MSFDVSGLSAYLDEQRLPLVKKAILEGSTIQSGFTQLPNVKNSVSLNLFTTDLNIVAGGACGFSSADTTLITQKTLTVEPISAAEELCSDALESKYLGLQMKAGSYQEDLTPINELYATEKAERLQLHIENAIWMSDTSGTGSLSYFDGLTVQLDADADVVVAGTGAITSANVIDTVHGVIDNIPVVALNAADLKVYMGMDTFRLYLRAAQDAGNRWLNPTENNSRTEYFDPILGITIKAVNGLNNSGWIVAGPAENFVVGTDLFNDFEMFRLWFSEDNDNYRFKFKGKLGVSYFYGDYIAVHKPV